MKNFSRLLLTISIISGLISINCKTSEKKYKPLHSFNGNDGATPKGTLTLVNNDLYGYTSAGGKNNKGVIFKTDIDGKNFQTLYHFEDGENNGTGKEPHHDAMLYFNNALYGAALYGGSNNNGVIFKINTDGSGYTPVHVFNGGVNDGAQPHSGVVVINNIFYGMTAEGGTHNNGALYQINPDGSGFSVIHSFHKSQGDNPHGKPVPGSDGHTVFGITKSGGAADLGVIFSFDLTDTSYNIIHTFQKGKNDGNTSEHGYLARSGTKLFGMTQYGGDNDKGIIFSINEDSSDFKIMHSFGAKDKDGKDPFGSLHLSNGFLYGSTQDGGENDRGTIFKIGVDGNGYEIIFSFDRPTSGEYPIDNVTLNNDGSLIFCFGQQGGENDDDGKKKYGTIVRMNTSGSAK
ncbi:MAG: choice-of-anchor tandem repeat GloVer-containing protein [Ignavibacteria bacterium]